jgi:hypothetical protein
VNALPAHLDDVAGIGHEGCYLGVCQDHCSAVSYSRQGGYDAQQQSLKEFDNMTLSLQPNPFHATTNFKFTLTESSQVTINVYDLTGRMITTVFDGFVNADEERSAEFDSGTLSSGVYIYRVVTADKVHSGRMILVK